MGKSSTAAADLISVDWGTSRLRLQLIRIDPFEVLSEVSNDDGVGRLYAEWRDAGVGDREDFFLRRLRAAVAQLGSQASLDLAPTPLIASGMVTSSVGMREIPYAAAPLPLSAAALRCEWLPSTERFAHPLLLVSGVATGQDVMRGEETQLLGLRTLAEDGLYILPGTHSKHVEVVENRLETFRTYMTGEFYGLISRASVLSELVEPSGERAELKAFEAGVAAALHNNLLNETFSIRARAVVSGQTDKSYNGDYLSGLLIGSELLDLDRDACDGIIVAAANGLRERYVAALQTLGFGKKVRSATESEFRHATALGHVELYRQHARGAPQ